MQWADRIGRRIKLRDLHVLQAVAQAGSMSKAANQLAVSVQVISKAIADLEHTAGVPLLDRIPQGVEPTAYGRALMHRGSFTMWAQTTAVSVTLPSHVSMLTGVPPSMHGIE